MGKYANKPKGKPTKRKTFKLKYKIERKVKQHKKRVKKQAKKFSSNGLKHKRQARSDYLPNMFPFKMQILQQAKKSMPKVQQIQTNLLDQSAFGLINLQNRCNYLPKPKQNLIKKYVTNIQHALDNVNIVFETLDIRDPSSGIDYEIRQQIRKKKNIKIISILTKIDTLQQSQVNKKVQEMKNKCQTVVTCSTNHNYREKSIQQILSVFKQTNQGTILVVGKQFTGKHSLIVLLSKYAGKYSQSPYDLRVIKITNQHKLIDSPFKIKDTTHPLYTVPNPLIEQSLQAQQENLIRKLFIGQDKKSPYFKKRDSLLIHYSIQDFTTVTDFINKIGRSLKLFGKGGSIDSARVRVKLIGDWFTGKLNNLLIQ